jgi:hypothetical protein
MTRRLTVVIAAACGLLFLIAAVSIAQYLFFLIILGIVGLLACIVTAMWRGDSIADAVYIYGIMAALAGVYLTLLRVMSLIGIIASTGIVAVGGGVLAMKTYHRAVQQRRINGGRCGHCGYDLREAIEMCPECGQPIPEELSRRRRIAESIRSAHERLPQQDVPDAGAAQGLSDEAAAPIQYTPPPPPDLSPIPLEPMPPKGEPTAPPAPDDADESHQ